MLGFARLVLMVGGSVTLLAGLVAATLGLLAAAWLRSLLPPVVIDVAAVGGAAFALGLSVATTGAVQLVVAVALRRPGRWVDAAAVAITGLLAGLLIALAAAAMTEAARSGSVWLFIPALALGFAALAYGTSAWGVARASVHGLR